MHGFFKRVNQKVNLGWCPIPTRLDIAISKDGFLKNPSKKVLTERQNSREPKVDLDLHCLLLNVCQSTKSNYGISCSLSFGFISNKTYYNCSREKWTVVYWNSESLALDKRGTRGYKTFFMLSSAEHEIFSANRYENANNSWYCHIN